MENIQRKFILRVLASVLLLQVLAVVKGNLIVSEVYFAGTDERIEITNDGSEDFSGDLQISGAKASSVSLDNLYIPNGENIVVGDNISMMLDQSMVLRTGLALNISDIKDLAISLRNSGVLIDQITGTASQIIQLKSVKSSLQKVQSGNFLFTTGLQNGEEFNVLPGYLANPGVLYQYSAGNNTGINTTGSISNSKIIISEIYFDGYDEWIEIANPSSESFSGDVILHGVSTSAINISGISINPGESVIVTQKTDTFLDQQCVWLSGVSITIQDDSSIAASLQIGSEIVDSFQVHVDYVEAINDQKTSFEKVLYEGQRVVTVASGARTENIISGYTANPGKFFEVFTAPINASTGSQTISGENSTGINLSGNICDFFGTKIKITEIFLGDENYPVFLELEALETISEEIFFSGTILTENFSKQIILEKGERILISNSANQWLSTIDTIEEPSLQLNKSGGILFVSGQSGQVFDKILTTENTTNLSLYEENIGDCIRNFGKKNNFSPGFDEKFLVYIFTGEATVVEVEKIVEIEKIVYVNVGEENCDCSTYINTGTQNNCGSGDYNSGSTNSIGPTISGNTLPLVEILSIDYDPPGSDVDRETVVLKSNLDEIVDMTSFRLHSLNRTTKNRIYGTLSPGSIGVFTGNYRFPNNENCVELLSGDVVLDQYCYPRDDNALGTGQGGGNGSGQNQTETGQVLDENRQHVINIENLVYDPEGPDTNRETISIKLISGSIVNVENMKLVVGTRKTKLFYPEWNSGSFLEKGEMKVFTGNFRFPNSKSTCVSLISGDLIYDSFCYDPEEEVISEPKEYPIVKIKKIVYDPPGKDGENESITLDLISGQSIDLDQMRLSVGGQNRRIYGVLQQGQQIFYGSFRFPNSKDTCVSLKQDDHIFDTLCYKIPEKEEDETVDLDSEMSYVNDTIHIKKIVFDPEGNDTEREKIILSLEKSDGKKEIDLADKFYLQWGNTRRSLKKYGTLSLGDIKALEGSFGFPNTKNVCVELVREDLVFDKYCYEIEGNKEETTDEETEKKLVFDGKIQIQSILPNPLGSDYGNEEITLLFVPGLQIKGPIDLQDDYRLKIGNTNRKLSGILEANTVNTIKGNFSFPNKAACISIIKDDQILDTFCYQEPQEGDLFSEKNGELARISTLDFSILQKAKMKKVGDQICIFYNKQKIYCKKYSFKSVNSDELKLYKNYIKELNNYLSSNRSTLFFNSPLRYYNELLKNAKKLIKKGQKTIFIDKEEIATYNVKRQAKLTIFSSPSEILKRKIISFFRKK